MNQVVLIGRLTKDPEMKWISDSQKAVTTFTLAVNRPYEKDDGADFLRIVVFGKSAENCERYLSKGSQIGVQGRIQTGSYETKTGEKRYTTDIIADRVEFLSSAKSKRRMITIRRRRDSEPLTMRTRRFRFDNL